MKRFFRNIPHAFLIFLTGALTLGVLFINMPIHKAHTGLFWMRYAEAAYYPAWVTSIPSVADLESGNYANYPYLNLVSYYGTPGGYGGGLIALNISDTTTADNHCSIFQDGTTGSPASGVDRFYRLNLNGVSDVGNCGAKGNDHDDTTAFTYAITDCYRMLGCVYNVPNDLYTLSSKLTFDVKQYSGSKSISIKLNGSVMEPTQDDYMIAFASNGFGTGSNFYKTINLDCDGAIIFNNNATGIGPGAFYAIDFIAGTWKGTCKPYNYQVGAALVLTTSTLDGSSWSETDTVDGFTQYFAGSGGGTEWGIVVEPEVVYTTGAGNASLSWTASGSTSFDGLSLTNDQMACYRTDGSGGMFNLGGYINRGQIDHDGGFLAGSSPECAGFYLNGAFPGTLIKVPYVDQGNSALYNVVFGPGYEGATTSVSAQDYNPTFIGSGNATDGTGLRLPAGWAYKLNVEGSVNQDGVGNSSNDSSLSDMTGLPAHTANLIGSHASVYRYTDYLDFPPTSSNTETDVPFNNPLPCPVIRASITPLADDPSNTNPSAPVTQAGFVGVKSITCTGGVGNGVTTFYRVATGAAAIYGSIEIDFAQGLN